jgi:hypothetical protein
MISHSDRSAAIAHHQADSAMLHSSEPYIPPAAFPSTAEVQVQRQLGLPTRAFLTAVTTSAVGEEAALPAFTLTNGSRHKLVFAAKGRCSRDNGAIRHHRFSLPEDDELVSNDQGQREASPNCLLAASVHDPAVQVLLILAVDDKVLIFWRHREYRARWDWVSWTTAREFESLKLLGALQLAEWGGRSHRWKPL